MVKLLNRAKMSVSGTPSTGNITLNAAVTNYQTFAQAGAVDTDVIRYAVEDGANWEVGSAVLSSSATVMTRTVEESSNSNNPVDLTSAAIVFATVSAADFEANPAPRWTTTPATSINLNTDGSTAVTLTGIAIDENFPVRYSWDGYSGSTIYDADSLPPQLASAPVINQSTGVTSLVGSSSMSNAGTYYHRSRATDGVNTTTQTTEVNLEFIPVTSGLTGFYDMALSTIAGTSLLSISDVSGNNSPNGNLRYGTYSATGFGGKPSYDVGTASAYTYFYSSSQSYTGSSNANSGVGSLFIIMSNKYTNDFQAENYASGVSWRLHNASNTGSALSYSNAGNANAVLRVDKTDVASPTSSGSNTPYSTLINSSTTKMHSIGLTNINFGKSGAKILTNNVTYGPQGHFRAALFYNRNLSNTEMDQLHDYYKNIYGSDMV